MKKILFLMGVLAFGMTDLALAKEYLLVGARPDKLFLVDMEARKVARSYTIPDSTAPQAIVPSPDGKVAYLQTNSMGSIVGIDLDNGEVVFRADLATEDNERVWNYGVEISPDGKELYTYDIPTILHPDRYESAETRLSVWRTDAGLDAKPIRQFPMPRRIHLLAAAQSGALYAMGWDFYKIDVQTGAYEVAFPLRHWTRENTTQPDALAFWQTWDNNGVLSTPLFFERTDRAVDDIERYRAAILALDLKTEEFNLYDFQGAAEVLFTSVLHPNRKKAYAVYNTLLKIDLETPRTEKRIDVDHSYYQVEISHDGSEVYIGGTACDIAIYDSDTLARKGEVILPDCADMGASVMRMVDR